MSLETYLETIKMIANTIYKELGENFIKYNECYKDGPGYSYSYIKSCKENNKHYNYIGINQSFTNLETEVGNFNLCTENVNNYNQEYINKKNNIIQKLGLIEKQREVYNYNGPNKLYETYYEYQNISHESVHEYDEIKSTWDKIK